MLRKPYFQLLFLLLLLGAGKLFAQSSDDRIDQIKSLIYQDPDSAEVICLSLLEDQTSISTSDFLQAQRFLGIILDLRGDYEASLEAYNVILNREISAPDSVHWANAHLGKGVIYHRLGQFDKALELYKLALDYYDRNGLSDRSTSALSNIAALYNNLGLYQEAIDIYRIQLNNPEVKNDSARCANIYLNLANSFEQKDEIDSAVHYNNKSIVLHKATDDLYGLGSNYHTKGTLFKHLGMLDSALYYYDLCISPTEGIYYKYNLPSILVLMAETYHLQGKNEDALVYLDSAYTMVEGKDDELAILEAVMQLQAIIWEEKGEVEQAARSWKAAHAALEKMDLQQLDARLLRFSQETKALYYEKVLAKKNAENTALVSENERKAKYIFWFIAAGVVLVALLIALYVAWWSRERYNKVLAAHNKDLDAHLESNKRLLSLIAHDFRTPMKSMHSMLDLIEHNRLSAEELKEFSNKARNHIRTTLRGMDQMLLWITKDKKEVNVQKNQLLPLLQEVKDFYSWELESLNAKLNISSLEDHSMRFDPGHLEAIARNIVGNSLKYCPNNCIIDVSYSQSATDETLSFHDNGPGIDEKTLAQIQSRTFRSLLPHQSKRSSSTGLGLELVFELADLNDARVVVDSTLGQGTSVSIVRRLN